MSESVLRDFFQGRVSAQDLTADVSGSVERISAITSLHRISDMDGQFALSRQMLVSLCDAVLTGGLPPPMLQPIVFALLASQHCDWEDNLISNVLSDWSCPEINYPLTTETVGKFKRWVLELEPYPERQ